MLKITSLTVTASVTKQQFLPKQQAIVLDHVYFVHPSTDVSAEISTDTSVDMSIDRSVEISVDMSVDISAAIVCPTVGRHVDR